jgi:hypothetical protein
VCVKEHEFVHSRKAGTPTLKGRGHVWVGEGGGVGRGGGGGMKTAECKEFDCPKHR